MPSQDSGTAATKRVLRQSIRSAIAALDPEERRRQENALAGAFEQLHGWADAGTVLLYVSAFPEEIATGSFLSMAIEQGRRLILPRVDRVEKRLRLHVVRDLRVDLTPGALGIPEPIAGLPEVPGEAIDWALIPGLAFDERGYRLGRGAGHYDRLLPWMRPDAAAWAVCLDVQLVTRLPVEPHDMPIDGVAAPDRIVRGARRGV